MRKCSRCKTEKALACFYKHNASKDGYRYQCITCHQSYLKDPVRKATASDRWYKKRKFTTPAVFMWSQAKHRAKFKYSGMEFTIKVDDIQIPEICPYFKVPFVPLDRNWGHSLDRIDSSKGYTKDNIQVISKLANVMKNAASEEQLISFAKGVLEVHTKGGNK